MTTRKAGDTSKPQDSHQDRPKTDPTKNAPFKVDLGEDGDMASVRYDLDEDELKEMEERTK